jgi:hypothetical protein
LPEMKKPSRTGIDIPSEAREDEKRDRDETSQRPCQRSELGVARHNAQRPCATPAHGAPYPARGSNGSD